MVRRQHTTECEQAGQWISLRLDEELSEVEQAGLDRHLDDCAACSLLAFELTGITQLLRSAPLLEFEPELPARAERRRVPVQARRAAFAAVLSVAAAAAAFLFLGSSASTQTSRDALAFRSAGEQIRYLHVEQRRIEPKVERAAPVLVIPPQMTPRRLL
jgi:anti-sigma factor RsiW